MVSRFCISISSSTGAQLPFKCHGFSEFLMSLLLFGIDFISLFKIGCGNFKSSFVATV